MKAYFHEQIGQLAHELTLSPLRHRLRQVMGVQRAIDLVDPAKEYPYAFICFHITGYRPRRTPDDILLSGKPLVGDLIQLLDSLTAAHPLPAAAARGRLYDVDALAKRFSVSTKTISRWRKRGLAGCWYCLGGDKPRLAFTSRAVMRFVLDNRSLVQRGASFQLMSAAEKQQIIDRARELVASKKLGLHLVTLALAEETGRAVETIRYTLRRHDRECPEEALFDRVEQAQDLDEGEVMYQAYVAGDSPKELADRFGKKEREVRGILNHARAKELAESPIDYMYNESFDAPNAEAEILSPEPAAEGDEGGDITVARAPGDLPAYLRDLYRTPLLGRELEAFLFRKMNYLLHRAECLRQALAKAPETATIQDVCEINDWMERANDAKNRIIQANLRLVVSIAKRHLIGNPAANLFELVSDGNISLMRAVEKFDYGRGFRFSTYASWAIMRSYARAIPEENVHAGRFQTGHEEILSISPDQRESARPIEDAVEDAGERLRSALAKSFAVLDDRERSILERHFGLSEGLSPQPLSEISKALGVSKERVRQIELRALVKLRSTLGEDAIELLAS